MPGAGGEEGPHTQGCVNHSRTLALQVGQGESGGAFIGFEQRRDKISLGVNRVTPAAMLGE